MCVCVCIFLEIGLNSKPNPMSWKSDSDFKKWGTTALPVIIFLIATLLGIVLLAMCPYNKYVVASLEYATTTTANAAGMYETTVITKWQSKPITPPPDAADAATQATAPITSSAVCGTATTAASALEHAKMFVKAHGLVANKSYYFKKKPAPSLSTTVDRIESHATHNAMLAVGSICVAPLVLIVVVLFAMVVSSGSSVGGGSTSFFMN